VFEIETLLTRGDVQPSGKLATPLAWIKANRGLLLAKWKEIVQ